VKLAIRPVDVHGEGPLLADLVQRYLNPEADGRRHDWLYRRNPSGRALAWLAIDDDTGRPVGMASAFPRRVCVSGSDETAWLLGDFCIRADSRSLGAALALQRACLSGIEATGARFCFDFPSGSMMAVYRRLGVAPWGEMTRLARPVRVGRHIRRVVKNEVMARGLAAAGDALLGLGRRRRRASGRVAVTLADGPCGDEFADLARRTRARAGAWVDRSPAYLNWRFVDHPVSRYERAEARRNGALVAYAVFRQSGDDGLLEDVFGADDAEAVTDLVEAVVAVLRARGVMAVSATMLTSHPWRGWLRRLGFVPRESKPMVVCVSRPRVADGLPREDGWFFMDGDRDS
jgi:hypothetical protein